MRRLALAFGGFMSLAVCCSTHSGCSGSSSGSSGAPPPVQQQQQTTPQDTTLTTLSWNGSQGVVGQLFIRQFPAAGGTLPYTWSIASGSVPPGLSFGPDGRVSGTPTQPGTFSYTYQVRDARGAVAQASLDQTIAATGGPQQFRTMLPGGLPTFVGTNFAFQPFFEGGQTPVVWRYSNPGTYSVSNQSTGVIQGTLVTSGSFQANATLEDATQTFAAGSPITFNFGVSLGGQGVSNPTTAFDGVWVVTYSGSFNLGGQVNTIQNETTQFVILNGVITQPAGNGGSLNQGVSQISNVTLPGNVFPIRIGGGLNSSAGTGSGTWAPAPGSGATAAGNNTWTAVRQ